MRNSMVIITLPNVLLRGIDASLGHILVRSTSLPSDMPREHAASSRDFETSTVDTTWKGIMTELGKGETIFEEPESVDMRGWKGHGKVIPPANIWPRTSAEEVDNAARRSEELRTVNVRRSRAYKDSRMSDERTPGSEEQRAIDVRRSCASVDSRTSDGRNSRGSAHSAQLRIAAEKKAIELRRADERLARVRDGRGYIDYNVI